MSAAAAWTVTEPEIMEMPSVLDAETAPDVEEDARLCIRSGGRELILDCRGVESLTSAGLRTMLVLASEMKKVDGKIAVCNLRGQPLEMFQSCSYEQMIPVFPSQAEAVAQLVA